MSPSQLPSATPEPATESAPTQASAKAGMVDWIVAAAVVLTALHRVNIESNILVGDAVLTVVAVLGLATIATRSSRTGALAKRMLPWFWLYVLSHILGLFSAGFQFWAFDTTVRNIFPILFFIGILALLETRPKAASYAHYALLGTAGLVFVTILGDTSTRPTGTFLNPGYAGYFLAAVALYCFACRVQLVLRAGTVILCLAGIYLTASFGAIMLLAAGLAYLSWSAVKRSSGNARVVLRLTVLVGLGALFAFGALQAPELLPEGEDAGPLSQERLDRSSDSRVSRWPIALPVAAQHPLGAGPGAMKHDRPAELPKTFHTDYLTFLTENGVIGLLALVFLVTQIWRAVPSGSAARTLIAAYIVAAVFRDTVNFRHQWVILALAVVLSWRSEN